MKTNCLALLVVLFHSAQQARCDYVLDLGTQGNASSWLVTGAGATQSPAFPYGGQQQEISITNNGGQTGTFVAGGSLANFNGFWYATNTFSLPSNTNSVSLTFSGLGFDDRGVLELNGNIIGNALLTSGSQGKISLPGPPDIPFTFTGITSGTITSGFNIGGTNTLMLVVNNTNGQDTSTFTGLGDGTHAGVLVSVDYTVTPEPSSLVLVGGAIGSFSLAWLGKSFRSRKSKGTVPHAGI